MKNTFFEYYPIGKDVIDAVWDKGIFCYDANVLLNLYRYSNETRSKIFENMEYFIKRTIMPYQACHEYHKNKREVEADLITGYDKVIEIVEKMISSLESGDLKKHRKHCAIDIDKDIIQPLRSTSTKITTKLTEKKNDHGSYLNAENTHEKITKLLDGKISDRFPEDELKKIYAEGKVRYEQKTPPGFADHAPKKHNAENALYGDLIIWKHLIEISKSKDSDIIFVTDDRKEDWWDIHKGQTKGSLPELHREFKECTSHNILIYSVEDFMKYAREHSQIKVSPKVISEIKELRKTDEQRNIHLHSIQQMIARANRQTRILNNVNAHSRTLEKIFTKSALSEYIDSIKSEYIINSGLDQCGIRPFFSSGLINEIDTNNFNNKIINLREGRGREDDDNE